MAWMNLTEPEASAIDLQELTDHLRLTTEDEYDLVQFYADAATNIAEFRTRRALIERSVRLDLDKFPECSIELPVSPVSAVSSVQYYDTAGVLQTFSSNYYVTDFTSILPRIAVKTGYVWPSTEERPGAARITFTAGYGASHENVPAGLRMAVMMLAAHFYENRTPVEVGSGSVAEIPLTLQYALDMYKIASL